MSIVSAVLVTSAFDSVSTVSDHSTHRHHRVDSQLIHRLSHQDPGAELIEQIPLITHALLCQRVLRLPGSR